MATFGSFALIVALALAAYNLLAGIIALRWIATGQPTRVSPERLADTARRAGIACFFAVTGAAFALVWSVFHNDFFNRVHRGALEPRPARAIQVCRAVERPGGLAAPVGLAAGHIRFCVASHAQERRKALRLRRHDSLRDSALLSADPELRCATVLAAPRLRTGRHAASRGWQRDSIPCFNTRRW